jgi:tripartite-type tricarboxylate transporter receptor subunit TctC
MRKLSRHLYLFPLAMGLLMAAAHASDFPVRPIKIVVPYAAGGGGDVLARLFADKLKTRLGQPVLVETGPVRGP